MREARRPAARAHAHEALLRFPVEGLRADVARLALCVVRARLRRDRDGHRVAMIRIELLGAACFLYFPTELVVPALFPVLLLARRPAVACAAAAAFLSRRQAERGIAGGASHQDHRLRRRRVSFGQPYGPKTAGGHPSASLAEVSLSLVKRRTTRGLPQVKPAW